MGRSLKCDYEYEIIQIKTKSQIPWRLRCRVWRERLWFRLRYGKDALSLRDEVSAELRERVRRCWLHGDQS
jgi:hypothetical protein